jgi:hypothetical protein
VLLAKVPSCTVKTPFPLERRRGSAAAVGSLDETKIDVLHRNVGVHETDLYPAMTLEMDPAMARYSRTLVCV